jgi:3-methyladenine DNA glycosylase AlkD
MPSRASQPLISAMRRALRARADPAKAPAMQAYMKSVMPYLGAPTPQVRDACGAVFTAHVLPDAATWRDTVLTLWREARYREERYAAIELSGCKTYDAYQTIDALPMYEEIITTGAWWDYVDVVAIHRIGPLLQRHPQPMHRVMRAWARHPDMWKRRTAILCQLSFKQRTDLDLLYACIEPSIGSGEFFLRKAIGWALREHAKTDAAEVIRYVRLHSLRLSPLSKREALKTVLHRGLLRAVP